MCRAQEEEGLCGMHFFYFYSLFLFIFQGCTEAVTRKGSMGCSLLIFLFLVFFIYFSRGYRGGEEKGLCGMKCNNLFIIYFLFIFQGLPRLRRERALWDVSTLTTPRPVGW